MTVDPTTPLTSFRVLEKELVAYIQTHQEYPSDIIVTPSQHAQYMELLGYPEANLDDVLRFRGIPIEIEWE